MYHIYIYLHTSIWDLIIIFDKTQYIYICQVLNILAVLSCSHWIKMSHYNKHTI